MQLSKNFSLAELTVTETGLLNVPGQIEQVKLMYLANFILQPIRARFGSLKVSSGYRCEAVNAKINGSKTSQHMLGEACDFNPPSFEDLDKVFEWIVKDSGIIFGQCIRESARGKEWIHISLPRIDKPNQVALVYNGSEYRPYAGCSS